MRAAILVCSSGMYHAQGTLLNSKSSKRLNISSPSIYDGYLWRIASVVAGIISLALLGYWIPTAIRNAFDVKASNVRTIFALCLFFGALAWPKLRLLFPLSCRWSWVSLVPCLSVMGNLSVVPPNSIFSLSIAVATLLFQKAVTIGILEEFLFRGIPFARGGELNPRLTVLLSTAGFAAVHFVGLTIGTPGTLVFASVTAAIPLGIVFGVLRLATKGVILPAVCHALVDISAIRAMTESSPRAGISSAAFVLLCICSILVFLNHPVMKGVERGGTV